MQPKDLVLEARSLACERGGRLVFKNLSFTAKSGEMLELRGPNGAGKSSLLRLIAGLNQPSAGTLSLSGVDRLAEHAHFIGHSEAVKAALTVAENLSFWQSFFGGTGEALNTFKLTALAADETRLLSQGQRRRLALSRLIAAPRPLWLLDEPSVGLDKVAVADLRTAMENHVAQGGIIIAATHVDLGIKSRALELAGRP